MQTVVSKASPAPSLPLPAVKPLEASSPSFGGLGVKNASIYANETVVSKETSRTKNADCVRLEEDPWGDWKPLGSLEFTKFRWAGCQERQHLRQRDVYFFL
jgi:hypothetical protein